MAQDLLNKGPDILFHAEGADGLGLIQAVKEARTTGKNVYVIDVDSDQHTFVPEAVLTSMVKHVDLAVYETVHRMKEGGVSYAEIRLKLPEKQKILDRLEALRKQVVASEIKAPSHPAELSSSKGPP